MEKGPRVQDDVISVAENLIEEIILQDKCHKTKYVDNNPQTSTSQIEQKQKPNLNQQNNEETDLHAQRGTALWTCHLPHHADFFGPAGRPPSPAKYTSTPLPH